MEETFVTGIGYPFCVFDASESVVACNTEFENLLGVGGISGMTLKGIFEPTEFAPLVPGVRAGLAGGKPEPRHVTIKGFPPRYYQAIVKPIQKDGVVKFAVMTLADISEKIEALQFANRAREFYNAVFDEMPQAYLMVDEDFAILRANLAAQRLFGLAPVDILGVSLRHLLRQKNGSDFGRLQQFRDASEKTLRMGETDEISGVREDGSTFPARITIVRSDLAEIKTYSVIVLDLTDDREHERKVIEEEKKVQGMMRNEALGKMAGKFAHDMNNVLAVIGGFSEILALTLAGDEGKSLEEINLAVKRGAGLTSRILAYTGRQQMESNPVDISLFVRENETRWKEALGDRIKLRLLVGEETAVVQADEKLLTQVVLSLLANCREALHSEGSVAIGVDRITLNSAFFSERGIADIQGSFIEIFVDDNGPGIDAAKIPRLFEPFALGGANNSSGFGLAIVYGIIKQHGGFIFCESKVESGTKMRILLPVIEEKVTDSTTDISSFPDIDPASHTVLVVEDEDPLLRILESSLSGHGFRVLTAPNGREALEVVRLEKGEISLLVTDVMMPEITGIELALKLLESHPYLPVIFVTGYANQIIDKHPVLRHFRVVNKPFSSGEIVALSVREIARRVSISSKGKDASPE